MSGEILKRDRFKSVPAVIEDGGATSGAAYVGFRVPLGLVFDADFDGTGVTKFQVSVDGVTYQDLFDESNALVAITTVAAERSYGLDEIVPELAGWPYIKVVSNANQNGAASTVWIACKG